MSDPQLRTDGETWTHCGGCHAQQGPRDFFCAGCGRAHFPDPYAPIFAAPTPEPKPVTLKRWDTVAINKHVRALLRELGILDCRVTKSSSGRYCRIELPRVSHEHKKPDGAFALIGHENCPICHRWNDAVHRVAQLILAAFPTLDDRSDYQSDLYDFVFSFA